MNRQLLMQRQYPIVSHRIAVDPVNRPLTVIRLGE